MYDIKIYIYFIRGLMGLVNEVNAPFLFEPLINGLLTMNKSIP